MNPKLYEGSATSLLPQQVCSYHTLKAHHNTSDRHLENLVEGRTFTQDQVVIHIGYKTNYSANKISIFTSVEHVSNFHLVSPERNIEAEKKNLHVCILVMWIHFQISKVALKRGMFLQSIRIFRYNHISTHYQLQLKDTRLL